MSLLNGSVIYRSMGSMSRTLAGSQPPGSVFAMLLTIYSGFAVPFREMRPWLQWFSYINPVYYVFEAMVVNEVIITRKLVYQTFTKSLLVSRT